jgi:alpha-ribazole phosphatase
MELYLIRHTAPAVGPGICYGQEDIALADSFSAEAMVVLGKLAGVAAEACYTSPLQRCVRLASMLGVGEPSYDSRLQELHFGTWEMQPWDAIPRDQLDEWGADYVDSAPPCGETFAELHRRAAQFLREVASSGNAGPVLVVTHAGVIRAMLAEVLQLPLEETFRFQLDYGGVTQLHLGGAVSSVGWINR